MPKPALSRVLLPGLGALAGLALAALAVSAPSTVPTGPLRTPLAHDPSTSVPSRRSPVVPAARPIETARRSVQPAAPRPVRPEAAPAPSFSARIVDSRGAPVAGARLVAVDVPGRPSGRSDAGGHAVLELALGADRAFHRDPSLEGGRAYTRWARSVRLQAVSGDRRSDPVRATLRPGERVPLGTLVLQPCGAVTGRALDAEGRPAVGIDVFWRRDGSRSDPTATDKDGVFRLEGVAAGTVEIVLGSEYHGLTGCGPAPPREPHTTHREVWVREGQTTDAGPLQLKSWSASLLTGRVFSPEGLPLAGVQILGAINPLGVSDDTGRFSARGDALGGRLVAVDLLGRFPTTVLNELPLDRANAVLTMDPPDWLEFEVIGPAGPLPDARVRWRESRARETLELESDHRGVVRAPRPSAMPRVTVSSPGLRTRTVWLDTRTTRRQVVELVEGPCVTGRVLSEGRPVADALVTLHGALPVDTAERGRRLLELEVPRQEPFVRFLGQETEHRTRTSEDGSFTLELPTLRRRKLRLEAIRVEARGLGSTWIGPFEWGRKAVANSLGPIELEPAGSIRGRIVTAPGELPEGLVVGVSNGDGLVRTRVPGPDGGYRFHDLAPGPWQVRLCPPTSRQLFSVDSTGLYLDEVRWDCEVSPGRETRFDLDVRR